MRRRRLDPRAMLAAAALAAVLAAILLRWAGIAGGWWHGPDRALLLALRHADDLARPVGPQALGRAALAVTALGSGVVLTMAVAVAAAALLAAGLPRHALLLVAATWSGGAAVDALKQLVARARPALVPHLAEVASASFPSAHAADSALVCLAIATLATARAGPALRRLAIAAALGLALLIGATRVYLGVHWPSDVAAGWLFGSGWAMAWWYAAARLARGEGAR